MSVIPLQPLGGVVIVLPAATAPAQTASGIILADVTHEPETSGTIVAVGTQFRCSACEAIHEAPYKIGDRVLFGRGAGSEIDGGPFGLDGESFLLLQESELLALLTEDAVCEVV